MKVELAPYNPQWPTLFLQEKEALETILGNVVVSIEHVGSTAIPAIAAKPVIDILVGVSDLEKITSDHQQALAAFGYRYNAAFEVSFPYRQYFQKDNAQGLRTHQLHVVNYPSVWWEKMLLFRNYLRHCPVEAKAYEAYKFSLAKQFPDSVPYALAKTAFCEAVEAKAYADLEVNKPHAVTERLYGYMPQIFCLKNYLRMFQDPMFIQCFGVALAPERIKTILTRDMGYWNQYRFAPWVWFDKATHQFVGEGGINHTTIEGESEIELTYSFMPAAWGKGFAAEIGQYALDYGFNHLNLSHVMCFTLPTNHQSLRVMEKLGFHYVKPFTHADLPHKLYRRNHPKGDNR
jgi:GrpB-like predicted nucleotidyltransferase (UPF0157 family)